MEYFLHIQELASLAVKLHPYPKKLLCQHRDVNAIGIIARQIAMVEELLQLIGHLPERRRIFHHLVTNAMDIDRRRRDRNLRIDQFALDESGSIRMDFYN